MFKLFIFHSLDERLEEKINAALPKLILNQNISSLSSDDFYAIVFCPTKGDKRNNAGLLTDLRGVPFVYENLISNSKGFYYADDSDAVGKEIQQHFEDFTTDKLRHIVCTKAFGMGIDKKDIRATYHYVYSGSLESLVQEAGRSGRDRKISEANILVSKNKYVKVDIYKFLSENKEHQLIKKMFTRKAIRQTFDKKWDDNERAFRNISFSTLTDAISEIDKTDFSLLKKDGTPYNILLPADITKLRDKLKEKDSDGKYKFLVEKYDDRNIHDYFHGGSFKGIDTEKSQFLNLFQVKEFQTTGGRIIDIPNQDTLVDTFNNSQNEFKFIITGTKIHPNASDEICRLLNVNPTQCPQYFNGTFKELIEKAYKYSQDFNDFIFLLEENCGINIARITTQTKEDLLFVYSRDRETMNDTGRLIYRMHSMGFLEDYLIDYNRKLYNCTFKKLDTINEYIAIVDKYLRRYLSENTTIDYIKKLKTRLSKPTLIDNVLECLFFLSEFSYKEIASKRQRATDEIEEILNTSITDSKYVDLFQQNLFIKEQIYFYFNAKYARIGFKINGKPRSLLDDHKANSMDKQKVLDKYLKVFKEDGAEQNNYKHMIGSCKKILRSLSETDLGKEWLLYLLKAFSMYSVNNASYISEANEELERGFDNLYKDKVFHGNNFEIIEPIFKSYFERLEKNIQKDNPSFKVIKLIRVKILLKMQQLEIDNLINKNKN